MNSSLASCLMERWIGKNLRTLSAPILKRISSVVSTGGKATHAGCEASVFGSRADPKVRIRDLLTKPAGKQAEGNLTESTGLGSSPSRQRDRQTQKAGSSSKPPAVF